MLIWRLAEARDAAERCGDLRSGAEIRLLLGDAPGAERVFARLLKEKPADAKTLYGMALAVRERPETALGYAERAAAAATIPRRRAAAHELAAGIKLDLGDRPGARASFLKALDADKRDLDSLDGLARLTNDADYAERAERVAAEQPAWLRPPAFRLCGRLWSALGNKARAVAAFRRAIAIDPEDVAALTALVELKRAQSGPAPAWSAPAAEPADAELSKRSARLALAADSADLDALRRMIELARARGNPAAAAGFAERLQEAAWDGPLWRQEAAFRLAGRVWIELGYLDRASRSLRAAREFQEYSIETTRLERLAQHEAWGTRPFNGSVAWAYLAVARARAELGDGVGARLAYEGAEAVLRQALKSSPGNAFALQMLGEVELEKSQLP